MSDVPIAILEHVTLKLGTREVLRDVSARFVAGEVVALVGPNGAGKSSLLKLLAGLITPASGRVTIDGHLLSALSPSEVATRIAYLPQARDIHWPMAVRAIVGLGRLPHQMRGATTPSSDAAATENAMAVMDITAFAERPVLALSGGEQARVLMARALAQEPKLLLADEPTAGLDLAHQLAVMEVLRARAGAGASSLIALHDLGLAARYADRVLLLQNGQIVAHGAPSDVLTPARISAVYGVDMLVAHIEGQHVFVPRSLRHIRTIGPPS